MTNNPQTPTTIEARMARIRRELAEMREYKTILAEDGLTPDKDDKERESALIVQLLRLERDLNGGKRPPRPNSKTATGPSRRPRTAPKRSDASTTSDTPRADKTRTDRTYTDRPRADRPRADRSRADRPRADRPRADRPRADRPRADRPRADRPRADKTRTDRTYTDRPRADKPRADRPRADKPAQEKSSAKKFKKFRR